MNSQEKTVRRVGVVLLGFAILAAVAGAFAAFSPAARAASAVSSAPTFVRLETRSATSHVVIEQGSVIPATRAVQKAAKPVHVQQAAKAAKAAKVQVEEPKILVCDSPRILHTSTWQRVQECHYL